MIKTLIGELPKKAQKLAIHETRRSSETKRRLRDEAIKNFSIYTAFAWIGSLVSYRIWVYLHHKKYNIINTKRHKNEINEALNSLNKTAKPLNR